MACARPLADAAAAAGTRNRHGRSCLAPLNWTRRSPAAARAAGAAPADARSRPPPRKRAAATPSAGRRRPTPSYPAPTEQTETLPCQIVTGAELQAHLGAPDLLRARDLGRAPADAAGAHHRAAALRPVHGADADRRRCSRCRCRSATRTPTLLGQRQSTPVQGRSSRSGGELNGADRSATSRPTSACSSSRRCGDDGSVKRMFVPRARLHELRGRPADRRGAGRAAAARRWAQVDRRGRRAGASCAAQKLGDILVDAADRHARAAARGDRAPAQDADGAHRRGADRRSACVTDEPARTTRWRSSSIDRSVPLGELLVRMGVVSRADLQTALARKMGYPLVDLARLPGRAPRRCASCRTPSARACEMLPLMLRDGRLVVALDDPSRRDRARRGRVHRRSARSCRCWRRAARSTEHAPRRSTRRSAACDEHDAGRSTTRCRSTSRARTPTRCWPRSSCTATAPARRSPTTTTTPIEQSDNSLVRLINIDDRRGAHAGRLRHPHRDAARPREDPRPLPQGRPAAHLPRAAARPTATR